jgi:hypothetical protein
MQKADTVEIKARKTATEWPLVFAVLAIAIVASNVLV